MSKTHEQLYEFGPFRLDAAERVLCRDSETIPLPPKVFDTLLALVERSGRVVEKDELMRVVWPGTFVSDPRFQELLGRMKFPQ